MIAGVRRSFLDITRDDVKLSDKDIIGRYLGIYEMPCKISSPLRQDDNRPSFSMMEKGGVVFWKDFGTGEKGNAVTLMSKLWGVDYSEALLKIKLDTENSIPRISLIRRYQGKVQVTKNSTISVRVRRWQDWDREFWGSYGITEKFCRWCNVFPVSHAIFSHTNNAGKEESITVPMDKYAYAYFEWKDGKESIKLYQPYSTRMKWLSKHDASVWDLWKHAFKFAKEKSNEAVILTSSRKDAMCLWSTLSIPAMSLQGEGYIPKPQVMQQVLDTFKNVYIWYDNDFSHENDNPGQDNARKLISLYPALHNICIPSELQSKDPSDLYKNRGEWELIRVWEEQKQK